MGDGVCCSSPRLFASERCQPIKRKLLPLPYPKRSQVPWTQLEASIQRALLWLHACTLLRREELLWVAWPGAVSRQWSRTALHGWADDEFIVPVDDGAAYGLGRTGAAKLGEAGIAAHFAGGLPAPRVRPGIVLAGQFAVALARDLLPQPSIAHFTWVSRPFSGTGPRADGYGGLCYSIDQRSLRAADTFDLLHLKLPDDAPAHHQALMWLLVEVDLGTETTEQLEQRAARWGVVVRKQRSEMAPHCWPYIGKSPTAEGSRDER